MIGGKRDEEWCAPALSLCQSMNPNSVSDGLSSVGFVYQGIKTPKMFIWLCFFVGCCWPGDACCQWYLLNLPHRISILTYEKGDSRQIRIRVIQCPEQSKTGSVVRQHQPKFGAPVLACMTPNNLMRFANKVLACPNFGEKGDCGRPILRRTQKMEDIIRWKQYNISYAQCEQQHFCVGIVLKNNMWRRMKNNRGGRFMVRQCSMNIITTYTLGFVVTSTSSLTVS